jgi:hypothetical protein
MIDISPIGHLPSILFEGICYLSNFIDIYFILFLGMHKIQDIPCQILRNLRGFMTPVMID